MLILVDENCPGDLVAALRERGHDVAWILTDSPGVSDRHILNCALGWVDRPSDLKRKGSFVHIGDVSIPR